MCKKSYKCAGLTSGVCDEIIKIKLKGFQDNSVLLGVITDTNGGAAEMQDVHLICRLGNWVTNGYISRSIRALTINLLDQKEDYPALNGTMIWVLPGWGNNPDNKLFKHVKISIKMI